MNARRDRWSAEWASPLASAAIFVAAGLVLVAFENWSDRRDALRIAEQKASLLIDRNLATHDYFGTVLKPALLEGPHSATLQARFDPRWMSSTYALRHIDERFRSLSAEQYYLKDAAIDAREPGNEADDLEREFLVSARAGGADTWSGTKVIDGKPWFVVMRRGEVMSSSCLGCHDVPSRAPPGLVEAYGTTRGFGRREGDLASVISARIPLEGAYAAANAASLRLSVTLAAVLGVAFAAATMLNRRLVFAPLARLRRHSERIARGERDGGEALALPRGRDLQALTDAFNSMSARLSTDRSQLERQVAERTRALESTATEYRLLFEENPLPMWVYDSRTIRFMAVNAAAIEHYGYTRDQFLSMTLNDIRPAEDVGILEQVRAELGRARSRSGIFRHVKRDGSVIHVEIVSHHLDFRGRPARLVLANDVSERLDAERALRETEQKFRQAQKMDAMGRLAGGVAHDFNNIVTVINSFGRLLLEDIPGCDVRRSDVQEIVDAADRAARLTRQLLAFSRHTVTEPRVVNLNDVVVPVEKMLRRIVGEDVQIRVTLAPDLHPVEVDVTHVEQVLTNLIVNARDAMPRGGNLTLETRNVEVSAADAARLGDVEPGSFAELAVRDDGEGMTDAVKEHVFEPFFTTKKERGTGLGLSTVYGIVKQARGFVEVESAPGAGSTFRVRFPRCAPRAAEEERGLRRPTGRAGGQGRVVLLVEDETSVRGAVRRILVKHGFTVLEARGHDEALAAATTRGTTPFDVVLTDVVMPARSGPEVVAALRELHPGVPAVFMSGYANGALQHPLDARTLFIHKPFTPADLIAALERALQHAPAPN